MQQGGRLPPLKTGGHGTPAHGGGGGWLCQGSRLVSKCVQDASAKRDTFASLQGTSKAINPSHGVLICPAELLPTVGTGKVGFTLSHLVGWVA